MIQVMVVHDVIYVLTVDNRNMFCIWMYCDDLIYIISDSRKILSWDYDLLPHQLHNFIKK